MLTGTSFIERLKNLLKKNDGQPMTEEALQEIIDTSGEAGFITGDTHEMLSSIIEFKETLVQEVMIPRTDFVAVKAATSLQEMVAIIGTYGYSRYPVYEENLDNIIGILYAKDLLKYLQDDLAKVPVRQIMRSVYFIPETKKIQELLQELRKKGIHIAVAVDEYGGTSGLVTLSDLVEEIIGEIYEEAPSQKIEEKNIIPQDDGSYLVAGKTEIEAIEDLFHFEVDNRGKFESVGGLVIYLFGKIPAAGEQTTYNRFAITVTAANERRVEKVLFTPLADNADTDETTPPGDR
ncbi:MAG: HlyC/CorC family transporter [Deltaproteobacteria bacterium]|nr:HlyC/CorC family transporter [Candidatus Anaeroferrophillus wilburensis]MBN2889562.1 HlyC/CorC family transporter [Deltaproteobacteria bacterium]